MSFSNLGLSPDILKMLADHNYNKPYPIQKQAIPVINSGLDILGIAPTGTGKTASYVLPIINSIKGDSVKNRLIDVLVLVPTRELALQVDGIFKQFSAALPSPLKTMAVYGGVSINPQMKALFGTQILIATPGRLIELLDNNALKLSGIKTLVIDEADKMLNLGFSDEMSIILKQLPAMRQSLLFSATLNAKIEGLKKLALNNAKVINVGNESSTSDLIRHTAYAVSDEKKGPLLRHLIKQNDMHQVLVFVSSIKRADNVASKLRLNGIESWPIHSKKGQGSRIDLLTKFKHGKLRVLVATDLIARGIDIEFLPFVVNYELPRSPKDYIHRTGRTGRAENPGEAISLITPGEMHHFEVIQKKIGIRIELIDSAELDLNR